MSVGACHRYLSGKTEVVVEGDPLSSSSSLHLLAVAGTAACATGTSVSVAACSVALTPSPTTFEASPLALRVSLARMMRSPTVGTLGEVPAR